MRNFLSKMANIKLPSSPSIFISTTKNFLLFYSVNRPLFSVRLNIISAILTKYSHPRTYLWRIISGAMYSGVPQNVHACEKVLEVRDKGNIIPR